MDELRQYLAEEHQSLVSDVAKTLSWDIGQTVAFCIELLYNVNADDDAKLVNAVLNPILKSEMKIILNKFWSS